MIDNPLSCPCCGSVINNDTERKQIPESMYRIGPDHTYLKCSFCNTWVLGKKPDHKIYEEYYGRKALNEKSFETWLQLKRMGYELTRKGFIGWLLSYIFGKHTTWCLHGKLDSTDTVLDVGCANGVLPYALRNFGFSVDGIDPEIESDISYSNGLVVRKLFLSDISEKYSVIILSHVLEHISDPLSFLIQLKKCLRPGGQLIIRLPVSDSLPAEKYGKNWFNWSAPYHLFIPTRVSIRLLFERANYKLQEDFSDGSFWSFLSSEYIGKGIPFSKHMNTYIKNMVFLFGCGRMYVLNSLVNQLNKANRSDMAVFILRLK